MKKLFLLIVAATVGCFISVFGTEHIISSYEGFEGRLTTLHNIRRSQAGVGPLLLDSSLSEFAANHSKEMARNRKLKHSELNFEGRLRGENIAQTTHEDESLVMKNWVRSTLHRNNLESSFYKKIGVGRARSKDGYVYWTVVFNGP